jgi:hypothetical protein
MTLRVADYLLKILEETNHELVYNLIYSTYSEIGRQHRIAEKYEDIGRYYDMGLSYAVKSGIRTAGAVKYLLTWLENNPWFEEARKHESFNSMIEKYKPFAE